MCRGSRYSWEKNLYRLACQVCSAEFESRLSQGKFCQPKCQWADSREKRKASGSFAAYRVANREKRDTYMGHLRQGRPVRGVRRLVETTERGQQAVRLRQSMQTLPPGQVLASQRRPRSASKPETARSSSFRRWGLRALRRRLRGRQVRVLEPAGQVLLG